MLKQISTHQLRIGMHVHEVCGSWLAHPFWRGAFQIEDAQQIAQLRAVEQVIIDTSKGLDVEAAPVAELSLVPVAPAAPASEPATQWIDDVEVSLSADDTATWQSGSVPAGQRQPDQPTLHDELTRARQVVDSAGQAMQAMFNDARLGRAIDPQGCLPLVAEITASVQRHPGALISLARLKTADDYTYLHSVAVCALMVMLSRQLQLDEATTREAGLAGLVHDIGKALMPVGVLNKPGALTPEEFAIMKRHPATGCQMLKEAQGVGPIALDVALHHHEKINGLGYPHGLLGSAISLYARMAAVCDVYDAITSNRPYKGGWDPADALQKMAVWAREGHFDDQVFQAFVKGLGIYPTGSLVRLQSDRLAVVVEQGGGSLLKPMVRVFHCARRKQALPPTLIDLAAPGVNDPIVAREQAADWGFTAVQTNALWQAQAA
ncbi:MAG: hypothetical protein RI907_2705 [Pseudomonadota bacterium]|jgi:HD-GYP domain-containing protein (c-di-GMP phosphodiesterase class II)